MSAKKADVEGATKQTAKVSASDILAEYEGLRAQGEMLEESINLINTSIIELGIVKESLNALKDMPVDNEVLVPMGGNSFTRARIMDRERVIVGIGSNVAVGKSVQEAVVDIDKRTNELEKLRGERAANLQQSLKRMEELAPAVQAILSKAAKKEG